MADKFSLRDYLSGIGTGGTAVLLLCGWIYLQFLSDDPRVARKEAELADCQQFAQTLQDSVLVMQSIGFLTGVYHVPIKNNRNWDSFVPLWGRELTCLVDWIQDSTVYLIYAVDTCFVATDNYRSSGGCRPVRSEMRLLVGRLAPIRLHHNEFILKCTSVDSTGATIEVYKPVE